MEEKEALNICIMEAKTNDRILHVEGVVVENLTKDKIYWSA